jgi:hypothetical protein
MLAACNSIGQVTYAIIVAITVQRFLLKQMWKRQQVPADLMVLVYPALLPGQLATREAPSSGCLPQKMHFVPVVGQCAA